MLKGSLNGPPFVHYYSGKFVKSYNIELDCWLVGKVSVIFSVKGNIKARVFTLALKFEKAHRQV